MAAARAADPILDGHWVNESVIGLIAQEYEGRAVSELLQNAHDQLDPGGRIHVQLIEAGARPPALYVANDGAPFESSNFQAILQTARSSKRPGSSIGYKGVGFKAVLSLCSSPEVYSARLGAERRTAFTGYRFRLGRPADVLELLEGDETALDIVLSRVPAYAVPIPLAEPDPDPVRRFAELGYATVIHLKLDQPGAVEKVRLELEQLLSGSAPPHLFLQRLSVLSIERTWPTDGLVELRRVSRQLDVTGDSSLELVDLADHGSYVVATRRIGVDSLRGAIRESIKRKLIDPRWQEMSTDVQVSVASRVGDPADGRLYAFLPMGSDEIAPFAGHANAPFATRLARDRVRFDIPLNDALMDHVARCAHNAALRLKAKGGPGMRPVVADLIGWVGPHARRFSALIASSTIPADRDLVPVISVIGKGWQAFDQTYTWQDGSRQVLAAAELVRRSSATVIDPILGGPRSERLEHAARDVAGHDARPSFELMGRWVEEFAASLARRRVAPATWMDFYDELADLFQANPSGLEDRRVLLVEGGSVAETGQRRRGRASNEPVVFFPPVLGGSAGEDDNDSDVRGRVPAGLKRRIAFMHSGLVWTRPGRAGRERENRPARDFLAANRLVRPYEAQDVLLLVRDVVAATSDRRLHADALKFTFAQTQGRAIPSEPRLDSLGLRVPTRAGPWLPAERASFGASWLGTDGAVLEAVIAKCGPVSAAIARLSGQLLADPESWPNLRLPRPDAAWVAFLRLIGVRDGLWPTDGQRNQFTAAGWEFNDPTSIARYAGLDHRTAGQWALAVKETRERPRYVTVAYQVEGGVPELPGQGDFAAMDTEAKKAFAEALVAGLSRWDEKQLFVEIRRPRNSPTIDTFRWPSPALSFLRTAPWVPVSLPRTTLGQDARELDLVPPADAWYHDETGNDRAPAFVPLITAGVRRAICADDQLRQRFARLGVRRWDDPSIGAAQLALIADSFARFGVLTGLELNLRKAYQRAWSSVTVASNAESVEIPARLLVAVRGRVEVYDTHSEARDLWVAASEDRLTETVLRTIDYPVLIADPKDGPSIARMLARAVRDRLRCVGSGDTTILVDGQPLVPTVDAPRLIDDAGSWLAECVALTLELKTTLLNRQSEGTVRQALDRLRRIRWQRGSDVSLSVLGVAVLTPSGFSVGVPADDDVAPTIAVRGDTAFGAWEGLRVAVPMIAELLRQRLAAPALELAIVKLAQRIGTEAATAPSIEDYAIAFDEQPGRVRSVLLTHREELADLVFRLRPVVAVLAGVDEARDVSDTVTEGQTVDLDLLRARLASTPGVGERAEELLAVAVDASDLGEVRQRLGFDLPTFNLALRALGEPYRPLVYERQAWDALERRLRARREEMFDALRARYVAAFDKGEPLDEYASRVSAVVAVMTPGQQVRSPEAGLAPDPVWAETYLTPPEEVVDRRLTGWLAEVGSRLGDRDPSLPRPLDELRSTNAAAFDQAVAHAAPVVAAWCATKAGTAPPAWATLGSGTELRGTADRSGLFDFRPIDEATVFSWLDSQGLWPEQMPRLMDLERLQLSGHDVEAQRTAEARDRQAAIRARRSVSLDDQVVSLIDDSPTVVVARVLEGIKQNPATLARAPRLAALEEIDQRPSRRPGGGGRGGGIGGRGWDRQLSDEQKTLIGLIGELAAYEWLGTHQNITPECWRSTNRAHRFGGDPGDDSLGYDIAVDDDGRPRYFEVKATTGDGTDGMIELTPGEVDFARSQARGRSQVLLVTNVLNSKERRFYLLPNPFGPESVGKYRLGNRGLRLSFHLQ